MPDGAAKRQTKFVDTGLAPALRQALSLISKFDELYIRFNRFALQIYINF